MWSTFLCSPCASKPLLKIHLSDVIDCTFFVGDKYVSDVKHGVCFCVQGQRCGMCSTPLHFSCANKLFANKPTPRCPRSDCSALWPIIPASQSTGISSCHCCLVWAQELCNRPDPFLDGSGGWLHSAHPLSKFWCNICIFKGGTSMKLVTNIRCVSGETEKVFLVLGQRSRSLGLYLWKVCECDLFSY